MRHCLTWLCVVGALLVAGVTEGGAPAPAAAVLDKETAEQVRKLQAQRRDLLRQALDVRMKLYQSARAELDGVTETSKRLLAAEVDLAATGGERVAAHERHLKI